MLSSERVGLDGFLSWSLRLAFGYVEWWNAVPRATGDSDSRVESLRLFQAGYRLQYSKQQQQQHQQKHVQTPKDKSNGRLWVM